MRDDALPIVALILLLFVAAGALVGASAVVLGLDPGGAVAALADFGADGGPTIEESALASFETSAPRCSDARSDNSSTTSRPFGDGRRLVINDTIAVPGRDTAVEADFEQIGPHRYWLDVQRAPGDGAADCHLEVRYNATLNLTESARYTVVLTYDGNVEGGYWSDPGGSGAFSIAGAPAVAAGGGGSGAGAASGSAASGGWGAAAGDDGASEDGDAAENETAGATSSTGATP